MNFFGSLVSRKYVWALAAAAALALIAAAAYLLYASVPQGPAPTTFFECAQLYKIKGANPRICRVPWGRTFVEYQGNFSAVGDDVRLVNLPPAPVFDTSPVRVEGEAKADWFDAQGVLEAELVAGKGDIVATSRSAPAPAGTLTTPGYARFILEFSFAPQAPGTQGALVIKKSGTDQALIFPVVY